jgi:hypothetical protein
MSQIIRRLEEGEHSIVLNLVLELVDHGKHFQCAALIDTGAMGLFISHNYTTHVQTQLHWLEILVTIQNVDSTKNRGGVIEFFVNIFLEAPDHREQAQLEVADLGKNQCIILGLPWLRCHNPTVDWSSGSIHFDKCLPNHHLT